MTTSKTTIGKQSKVSVHAAQLALLLAASSCGSGSAAILGSSSSGGSSPKFLEIITRSPDQTDPMDPATVAEPQRGIVITFNEAVDAMSAQMPGVFHLYEGTPSDPDDPDADLVDIFSTAVAGPPIVVGSVVTLELVDPLRLEQDYFFVIDADELEGVEPAVRPFRGTRWGFTVREGSLSDPDLVSFLFPISRVFYRHPDSKIPGDAKSSVDAVALIEGTGISTGNGTSNGFIIAAATIEDEGGIQEPTVIFRETEDADINQTRLGEQAVSESGLTSVTFSGGGKSFCSGQGNPKKRVYVSQYNRMVGMEGWEEQFPVDNEPPEPAPSHVDQDLSDLDGDDDRWLSWPGQLANSTQNETVFAWWGWTEFDASGNASVLGDYAKWDVWSVTRVEGSPWSSPQKLNQVMGLELPGFAGAPFLLEDRDDAGLDRIYAVWAQSAERVDLYGKLDTDGNGEIPDPELFANNNNNNCFPEPPTMGPGNLGDALTDGETIDSYYFATFEGGVWSDAVEIDAGGAELGRPTSMVIDDQGTCAIFWRSAANGISAATVDLRSSAPALAFAANSVPTTFIWDGVWAPCCGKFNDSIEKFINNAVPRSVLLPSQGPMDSRALITWAQAATAPDGDPTGEVRAVEFDILAGMFDLVTQQTVSMVIESQFTGAAADIGVGSTRIDKMGNAYANWSVNETTPPPVDVTLRADVFGARRASGSTVWEPVVQGSASDDFQINEDLDDACGISGGWSDTHPSGQLIFSWTNADCMIGINLSSLLRRFN